jgi:transposase
VDAMKAPVTVLINKNYITYYKIELDSINPLSPELNPICYLLALLAHDFLHVSKIRVK